jgi:hypothetical protein
MINPKRLPPVEYAIHVIGWIVIVAAVTFWLAWTFVGPGASTQSNDPCQTQGLNC